MKITITNDEGEVYVVLTDITVPILGARYATGKDQDGDVASVEAYIEEARAWEEANR